MSKQPEALRLADVLSHPLVYRDMPLAATAAAELRHLHSVNADLLEALRGLYSCWVSVCSSHAWNPDHLVQASSARAAIAKAEEA